VTVPTIAARPRMLRARALSGLRSGPWSGRPSPFALQIWKMPHHSGIADVVLQRVPWLDRLMRIGHKETGVFFAEPHAPVVATLTSCGFQEEPRTAYDWHGLRRGNAEFALLQYTLSGRGRIAYEGRTGVVEPGEAMLLFFPHDNRYWVEPGERWEFFYLCVAGADAVGHFRSIVSRRGPVVALDARSSVLARAADACADALDGRIASPYAASAVAYGIAMDLLDECLTRPRTQEPKYLSRVERLCKSQLDKPIGVADMARAAGMSRYHFTRRFQQARGVSPGQYLLGLRLEQAVRLVARGDLSVREVALRCGYADANYFCKAFRKRFGVSPGAFRSSGMY
jgi:AraC family transcriptional regulator